MFGVPYFGGHGGGDHAGGGYAGGGHAIENWRSCRCMAIMPLKISGHAGGVYCGYGHGPKPLYIYTYIYADILNIIIM